MEKPVGTLHLSTLAANRLRKKGIISVGQLLKSKFAQIGSALPTQAPINERDIADALAALAKSQCGEGSIDWDRYAKIRDIALYPKKRVSSETPARAFIRKFPKAASDVVRLQYGEAAFLVVEGRLLAPPEKRVTLQKLGSCLERTRERIRVIEEQIVAVFQRIYRHDDYEGCCYRFRTGFFDELRRLGSLMDTTDSATLSWDVWNNLLQRAWAVNAAELGSSETLILRILGFERLVPPRPSLKPIISARCSGAYPFRAAREMERLLTRAYPEGLKPQELQRKLVSKLGKDAPTNAELITLLDSTRILETGSSALRFRARANALKKLADRCYRILTEEAAPLSARELVRRARSTFGVKGRRVVTNTLVLDPRFVAVPSTATWALREWKHIETRTILELSADILHKHSEPIPESVLYGEIASRRRLAKTSLRTLLRTDKRFKEISPHCWILAKQPQLLR